MSDSTVQQLAALQVLSPAGDEVEMGTLWARQPVVLAMIRHFG